MTRPEWLPELKELNEFGGQWERYLEAVYDVFCYDFVISPPTFKGHNVAYRRDPMYDGKEAGFWHCISSGQDEEERIPETSRMARIGWIRAIIQHSDDPKVQQWGARRGTNLNWCIWYNEEYLIVLSERRSRHSETQYWQLITAYDTPEEHRKRKLRKDLAKWLAEQES